MSARSMSGVSPRYTKTHPLKKNRDTHDSDGVVVRRKKAFVANALRRYYNVQHFQIQFDTEAAIGSTEVGILHYFYGNVLRTKYGVSDSVYIVDAMAGAGTLSLCAMAHFADTHITALECDETRAGMLRENLGGMEAGLARLATGGTKSQRAVHSTYQAYFQSPVDVPRVDLLFFSPTWGTNASQSLRDVLGDIHGLVAGGAACARHVVIKISPDAVFSAGLVAFATRAVRHRMVFYGRHAFDFLVLCAPWHGTEDAPPSGASVEEATEYIRQSHEVPIVFREVLELPAGLGMAPDAQISRLAGARGAGEISAINTVISTRTQGASVTSTIPWPGATPQGLVLHKMDIECLPQAAQCVEALFTELRHTRAPGFQQLLGTSHWPGMTHAEFTRHGHRFRVRDVKEALAKKYRHLHNVVTDIEHVVKSALGIGSADLDREGLLKVVELEAGTGIPLHLENVRRAAGPMFVLPLTAPLTYDLVPSLVPGHAGGDGFHLRFSVPHGHLCQFTGSARYDWAQGMPFGDASVRFFLVYSFAGCVGGTGSESGPEPSTAMPSRPGS